MAFWGCILKPGATAKVDHPEGDILHLSQACLHNPGDGKNYIQAEVEGKKYAIACLEKGKKEHDSFDLFFNPDSCAFSNVGKSEVHLTGYFEPDEDMGDEGSEEEMQAVAAKAASPKQSPKVAPVATKAASPKVVAAQSPKVQAAKAQMDDDDEDDYSDLECEEEEELLEDEDEEDLDLEDEEEEEEEDDSEEAPPPGKRKAEAMGSPAKKPKVEPPKAAGSPKAGAVSGDVAAYCKKLQEYLKQNGKTNISVLGSKVPRPKDAPKMKVFFEQNKDKFKVEGEMVSAAK